MSATPIAVLSFLGFDGVSTLAEDAKEPQKNVALATVLVCFVAGAIFILLTHLGQLIWPDYHRFHPIETAFSDIGRLIGGPSLYFLIALLVIAQAWASGITSQASASRLLFGMARDGPLPHRLFGYIHPALRTPIYSVVLMGAIACLGALLLDLDQSAELVNARTGRNSFAAAESALSGRRQFSRRVVEHQHPITVRRRRKFARAGGLECAG